MSPVGRRAAAIAVGLGAVLTRSALADVTLTATNVFGAPGATATVAVGIASLGGSLPASVNFDLVFDPDRLSVSPQEVICDTACQAAEKSVVAALVEAGRLRLIVFGLNSKVIPDGELVRVPFAIADAAASGVAPVDGTNDDVASVSAAGLPSYFVDGSVCIGDSAGACPACGNGGTDPGEQCGESGLPSCASGFLCVQCECRQRGDCALNGGGVGLFDVLTQIDAVLARISPDARQQVVCDDDCNESVDLFDVLTGIDAVLGKRVPPLLCPAP